MTVIKNEHSTSLRAKRYARTEKRNHPIPQSHNDLTKYFEADERTKWKNCSICTALQLVRLNIY